MKVEKITDHAKPFPVGSRFCSMPSWDRSSTDARFKSLVYEVVQHNTWRHAHGGGWNKTAEIKAVEIITFQESGSRFRSDCGLLWFEMLPASTFGVATTVESIE